MVPKRRGMDRTNRHVERRALSSLLFFISLSTLVAGLLYTEFVTHEVLIKGFGTTHVPGHYVIGIMSAWVGAVVMLFGFMAYGARVARVHGRRR